MQRLPRGFNLLFHNKCVTRTNSGATKLRVRKLHGGHPFAARFDLGKTQHDVWQHAHFVLVARGHGVSVDSQNLLHSVFARVQAVHCCQSETDTARPQAFRQSSCNEGIPWWKVSSRRIAQGVLWFHSLDEVPKYSKERLGDWNEKHKR